MLGLINRWSQRFWILCLLAVVCGTASATARLTLESPTNVINLALAPGGSTVWTFRVRNAGTSGGAADFNMQERRYDSTALDQYQWTSLSPGCGAARTTLIYSQMVMTLPISDLALHESRDCSYRIARSASSRDDLGFRLCSFEDDWVNCYRHKLNVGGLPDTILRVEPVGPAAPGSDAALYRLTAINPSELAISSRIATTACREFSGGIFDTTPYLIDTDFPGGCPSALGEICLNFTGQNFDAVGFELGPVPAQGSHSCLIKLVPRPTAIPTWYHLGPYATPMYFRDDQARLADGAITFDPDDTNNQAVLGAPASHPVPLSTSALSMLALLILGCAFWFGQRALRPQTAAMRRMC